MEIFHIVLMLATLLCSLVAGLVLAFACVAMPGLGQLGDHAFLRAFQVIDQVIQNKQPLFMLVWVGSALAVFASGLLGLGQLYGVDRVLLIAAVVIYLFGVQLPTGTINVPLNNQLQTLHLDDLSETALAEARRDFEPRWNWWNVVRTVFAVLTSALLMLLLLRL